MPSRRDQLQSHQFLTQRVISAFVMREADPAQSPLRRGIGAVFTGVMVTVMVAAGFGVYGLLTKMGGNGWRTDGAVVIETETGAPFVYQGGQLHPMLNYASALLAAGAPGRPVVREPASALRGVPRGIMLGIPYAPDSLPDAGQLMHGPWTVCRTTMSATAGTTTTVAITTAPAGARPLSDRGLLAQDPAVGTTYLIWHGYRFEITASLLPGLFGVVTPVPVGSAWLNAVPRGPDIAPLDEPDSGAPSPAAPKYRIGQLLASPVGSGGQQYWLVLGDGLAPITELQKDIAISQGAGKPEPITVPATNAIARSRQLRADGPVALPIRPPALVALADAGEQICAAFGGPAEPPSIVLGGARVTGTPIRARTGTVLADQVLVPPGRGALVRVMTSPAATSSGFYLVTDLGIRYPIGTADVLALLGYTPDEAVIVPDDLAHLLPVGPALDPASAIRPASNIADGF